MYSLQHIKISYKLALAYKFMNKFIDLNSDTLKDMNVQNVEINTFLYISLKESFVFINILLNIDYEF